PKTGDLTVDVAAVLATLSGPTQTQRWLDNTLATVDSGGSTGAGASPTVSHSWNSSVGSDWAHSGADFNQATPLDEGALTAGAQRSFATQVLVLGTTDEVPPPPSLTDQAPLWGAKSLSASTSIALVGLADEVGRVTTIEDIAPPVGAKSLSASTAIALIGVSDDAPTILPIEEFTTI